MNRAKLLQDTRAANAGASPREIVEAFQRDLLRLAFVLIGDGTVAVYLARDVMLDVLSTARDEESHPGMWTRIVTALGRFYVEGADPEGHPDESGDDESARLRTALELLSRPMRTALVLRDQGGLNAGDVATLTGIPSNELDEVLDWSRARLSEAADRLAGDQPQRLLASLANGAPRRDLWPEIAPIIEEREAKQRRQTRRIVAATLGAVLVFALASVIWFIGEVPFVGGARPDNSADNSPIVASSPAPKQPPEPSPTPAPTPTNARALDADFTPEILIQGAFVDDAFRGNQGQAWFAFSPGDEEVVTPLPIAGIDIQHISPDGRWAVLLAWRYDQAINANDPNAPPQVPVLSVVHDGVEQNWEYEIPNWSFRTSWDSVIAGNRLYIISSTPEPATLTALDLETGAVVVSRTLEVPRLGAELRAGWTPMPEGDWYVDVGLIVAPAEGGPRLYAHVTLNQYGSDIRDRWTRWIYRIDPGDLRSTFLSTRSVSATTETGPNDSVEADFWLGSARILPDGSGLYAKVPVPQQLELQFLDFESGEVETLTTTFSATRTAVPDGNHFETFNSNDGRRLYVYSDLSGEVAVIDLARRVTERIFPLDLGGLRDGPLALESARLSYDGKRLYLLEETPDDWRRTANSQPPASTPIWIVDLANWRVIQRIDVPGDVVSIALDVNGKQFHVLSQASNPDEPGRLWKYVLISHDASTFEHVDVVKLSTLVERNAHFRLLSFLDIYRELYSRSPTIRGAEPEDIQDFTTLPRVRVALEESNVPVGVTVPIELEFLDPATGAPMTGPNPRVRFDPAQRMTLVFEQPGAKSVLSVTVELAPGQLQGTLKLKADGWWSARIIVGEDGDGFTLALHDVFLGTPAFEADDGRFYALRLETEPREPVSASKFLVRAIFVDAATGEPLPESVGLLEGMPETMQLGLIGYGAMNRDLSRTAHGVYEATIEIETPGSWSARLDFRRPESNTPPSQVEVGVIEVVDQTSP